MIKKRKIALLMSLVMMFAFSETALAAETEVIQDEREYLIVNGEEIVYAGEDYENPDTGEYVRWSQSGSKAGKTNKKFSFKIRYSVTSSKFNVSSTKVRITANAHVENSKGGAVSGYDGHLYSVTLSGILNRNLQFSVGESQSGTITGLKKRGKLQSTNYK